MGVLAVSDTVLLAGINAVVTIVVTTAGVVAAYFTLRAKMLELQSKTDAKLDTTGKKLDKADEKLEAVVVSQKEAAANVEKIELATNSMKDALVLKTEQEARARGAKEERDRADAVKTG